MPFVNGKYYMNPFYGRALERDRLRSAGAEHDEPQVVSAGDADGGHWVTINHRHVLIRERQAKHPHMSLSTKGLDFIKDYESLRLTPYLDQVGHATIGYGHKIQPDEDYSKGVTQSQAEALLEKDMQASVEAVNSSLERPVTQNEFDALVSFTYNVGPRAFRRSTLHAKIAHDQPITERDFTEYHYAAGHPSRGLLNRRIDEYNLFSGGGRQ